VFVVSFFPHLGGESNPYARVTAAGIGIPGNFLSQISGRDFAMRTSICVRVNRSEVACRAFWSNVTVAPPLIYCAITASTLPAKPPNDFAYVVNYAGDDSLIVSTDHGHADYSNDIKAIQTLPRGGKISRSLAQKILADTQSSLWIIIVNPLKKWLAPALPP